MPASASEEGHRPVQLTLRVGRVPLHPRCAAVPLPPAGEEFRALSWDDIRHYQKIIKILGETDRIMRAIELPLD